MAYEFKKLNIDTNAINTTDGYAFYKLSTETQPISNPYLTFDAEDGKEFTLKTYNEYNYWDGTLEYSTDTTSWNTWNGTLINSSSNGKLYLRGTNNTVIIGNGSPRYFVFGGSSTRIQCNGNIENLLDYATVANGQHPTMNSFCYYYMFYGCTSLTTAPELPATTLAVNCYNSMFQGCTSLTTTPELPATTLADNCYYGMFYGCISLVTLSELPATTLADNCYFWMFNGCTSLKVSSTQTSVYKYAWRIPTSGTGTTASYWNTSMLKNTGGTFTSNPSINKTYYTTNQPV